jgi:hypothetical protein
MVTNPFSVQTPEDISAEDAYHLFVDVFTDFYQVPVIGHTFLNGPRGSGKSMMFRYMLPDCQKLKTTKEFNKLDYFSIYIPIKKTTLNLTNLERLEDHAQFLLNEHLLVTYISITIFNYLYKVFETENESKEMNSEFGRFFREVFIPIIKSSGHSIDAYSNNEIDKSFKDVLKDCSKICTNIYTETNKYFRNLFLKGVSPYTGSICLYLDFLHPLIIELKKISIFPKSKPFFLLIDDADNLNLSQTKVLNTWVSFRTSSEISLKISTQLNYKSYRTISGQTIDSPHDYSEVNIATVYTSSKTKYYERLKKIVEKRIEIYNKKTISAEEYFPNNLQQESELKIIEDRIRASYVTDGKGATPADDIKRYARPDYIKQLKEKRAGSTYSYAGFLQLVSISSGIIRYFLEPASLMYSETYASNYGKEIVSIPHQIQDHIIQDYSDKYIFNEFENIFKEEEQSKGQDLKDSDKLLNLLQGLGGMFHEILISSASERRVFSVALTSNPDQELLSILKLGVRYGYIQESSIGNKQGTGRTKLYILSRLLAPHFKLDPTSFAGYKFMKSEVLKETLYQPKVFVSRMKASLQNNDEGENEIFQLSLFD